MVREGRRYLFGCFDALPRNIMSWIKIDQLILLEEISKNFQYFKQKKSSTCLSGLVVECQAQSSESLKFKPP